MHTHIIVETAIAESPRVAQLRGLFDLPAERTSRLEWAVRLPLDEHPWHIGLVTGPSGCGKSTLARRFWPRETAHSASLSWPSDRSILDAFAERLSIKEVTALLSAVGFSSPPAWLRPYHVLSTGQQFRVLLARLLGDALAVGQASSLPRPDGKLEACPTRPLIVLDEYTSVVDRTVAQIGSAALARAVRGHDLRFIAVTCHDDVIAWLQPDWVYRPAEGQFDWRCLRPREELRRPRIALRIFRAKASAWTLFAHHHYLSHSIHRGAVCFLATWQDRPVAFSAWLPFVGKGPPTRREHRTVTLPDFQGVGIGNTLSDTIASMWRGLGYRAISTTTHPAMMRSRLGSVSWRMHRSPSLAKRGHGRIPGLKHATTRLTAGFEYVGPAMPARQARALVG